MDVNTLRAINSMRSNALLEDEDRRDLMKSTFAARRRAVLEGSTIKRLKEDYPLLFERREFWAEVERMAGASVDDDEGAWYQDACIKLQRYLQKTQEAGGGHYTSPHPGDTRRKGAAPRGG